MLAAQACESQIDSDLQPYIACIEHRLAQSGLAAADRAGTRFQAWVMADLAVQQSSDGAVAARSHWWRLLQRELNRGRLTLDQLCEHRGMSCAEIRQRAARVAAP